MRERMRDKSRELAEARWAWLETLLHKVYVDAMIHGYKHGLEDAKTNSKTK